MDKCIVMAGGKGSRLGNVEKPLIKISRRTMLESVISALEKVVKDVYVAVSPRTPLTKRWCVKKGVPILSTKGEGYVKDLRTILKIVEMPVLIAPADLPFISHEIIKKFLKKADKRNSDVVTLVVRKEEFLSFQSAESISLPQSKLQPVGISLIKGLGPGYSRIVFTNCYPELLNVNTFDELRRARKIWRKDIMEGTTEKEK